MSESLKLGHNLDFSSCDIMVGFHKSSHKFEIYPHFVYQPAVRPGCASAPALEFLHNKDNCVGFTKLLFRKMFIHCAMVLPYIFY